MFLALEMHTLIDVSFHALEGLNCSSIETLLMLN